MTDIELKTLKDNLWHSADMLRAGAHLAANKYGQPILGLIFLRYADILFKQHKAEIDAEYQQYKGTRMEKEYKDIKPNDEQDGQDIVVRYNGKEIYYIEVKSKWSFDEPAHMSVSQMRKAVQNPDKYALCCVELTKYNSNEVESIDTDTILTNCYDHLDIGDKLSKLLKPIVDDNSDAEMNIKIYDYKCNLNKGFFVSTPNKGLQPLIDAIVKAAYNC